MYDSDPLYDFGAALTAARGRAARRTTARRELVEQQKRLEARHTCETLGMPRVTERQIRRHEQFYGSNGIDELRPYLRLGEDQKTAVGSHGGKRPQSAPSGEVRVLAVPASDDGGKRPWTTPRKARLGEKILGLHDRGLMTMAIADKLGVTNRVVLRYLREAEAA